MNAIDCGSWAIEIFTDAPDLSKEEDNAPLTTLTFYNQGAEPILAWTGPDGTEYFAQDDNSDAIHVEAIQIQTVGNAEAEDLARALETAAREIRKQILVNRTKKLVG